jgi:hypothetical protein
MWRYVGIRVRARVARGYVQYQLDFLNKYAVLGHPGVHHSHPANTSK